MGRFSSRCFRLENVTSVVLIHEIHLIEQEKALLQHSENVLLVFVDIMALL